jgi:predicted dinucleotide-binding enzyme
MNLQRVVCIWIALFTLLGVSPTGNAAQSTALETKETIAVIGTGDMGNSLGPRLAALGYPIVYGSRDPASDKVVKLVAATGNGAIATTQKEAAQQGDIVFLALPWPAMEAITKNIGNLDGKVLIDLSYPPLEVADDGYYQITIETSSAELIQSWNPGAKVVKAFGTTGSNNIDDTTMNGEETLPIASDDREAKEVVARIAAELGYDPVDSGPLRMARYIEGIQVLYLVPIQQERQEHWSLAFSRSNYWVCNPYITEDGESAWPVPYDADDLAVFPEVKGPPEPCP